MSKFVKGMGVGAVAALLLGATVWVAVRPTVIRSGPPPMTWEGCEAGQVEVMILGTFHFEQQQEVDVLSPEWQEDLDRLTGRLAEFAPDRVTVEYPFARNDELNTQYGRYLELGGAGSTSRDEIVQVGFRLAERLGHDSVFGVDVPINLWHDSIQVFDDEYPGARRRLRRAWNVQYPSGPYAEPGVALTELLRPWNGEAPPSLPEFGRFMPLVEGDVYAGALKLRPWYDRNLRTVQNFFRVLGPDDDRLFLVIGGSHVRVLRQILDLTPQFCAVDVLPYLEGTERPAAGDGVAASQR